MTVQGAMILTICGLVYALGVAGLVAMLLRNRARIRKFDEYWAKHVREDGE